MSWIDLLTGVIKLVSVFAEYLGNKQLIDAGEAKAVAKGQSDVLSSLERIQSARAKLADPSSDRAGRLRDKFTRPE